LLFFNPRPKGRGYNSPDLQVGKNKNPKNRMGFSLFKRGGQLELFYFHKVAAAFIIPIIDAIFMLQL